MYTRNILTNSFNHYSFAAQLQFREQEFLFSEDTYSALYNQPFVERPNCTRLNNTFYPVNYLLIGQDMCDQGWRSYVHNKYK